MRRLIFCAIAAILIAGCPGDRRTDESQHGAAQTSTTTRNPQEVPGNSTAMNPVMPPQNAIPTARAGGAATAPVIDVQLTEYEIRMPDSLAAGPQQFRIANGGKLTHNFVIEGPGISQKLASDLPRGDTVELTMNLPAGSYTVYCPIDGHRGKGMQRTVVVR
jgi:plastocyanin